jgi:carbon monoxide dehydrogenase subunit G
MEFEKSFDVPLPPDQAWAVLMDIQRIAPCMPGAELTEVVDPQTYKGKVSVRLGPVALAFGGVVKFENVDAAGHTAKVKAQGTDSKGRGGANAVVDFRIEPALGGSKVLVHTNLQLSGAVAQYGRGVGVIEATASQLIGQFANNLKAQISATTPAASATPGAAPASSAAPPPQPAAPISGFSLMANVLWTMLKRLFGRA